MFNTNLLHCFFVFRIKDASSNYFDRGLFELENSLAELEKKAKENFSAVGSDIIEVKKQLENIQVGRLMNN